MINRRMANSTPRSPVIGTSVSHARRKTPGRNAVGCALLRVAAGTGGAAASLLEQADEMMRFWVAVDFAPLPS